MDDSICLVEWYRGKCTGLARWRYFAPPKVASEIRVVEATGPVVIDGEPNESAWWAAPPIDSFFRIEPPAGWQLWQPSSVRLLYDPRNLYVGIFCRDTRGPKGIRVQDRRCDFKFGEIDNVYPAIDPQKTQRFAVGFYTSPLQNQCDLQVFDDSFTDKKWDALWKVRTTITGSGWFALYAIPFSTLRYDKAADKADSAVWRVSFSRLAAGVMSKQIFLQYRRLFRSCAWPMRPGQMGWFLPPPAANVRLQPYVLFQEATSTSSNGYKTRQSGIKAGGEIKWAVNPSAELDLTFNTDFAQADADRY